MSRDVQRLFAVWPEQPSASPATPLRDVVFSRRAFLWLTVSSLARPSQRSPLGIAVILGDAPSQRVFLCVVQRRAAVARPRRALRVPEHVLTYSRVLPCEPGQVLVISVSPQTSHLEVTVSEYVCFRCSDRKPVDKEDVDNSSKGGCVQQAAGWRKGPGYGHPGLASAEEVKWFPSCWAGMNLEYTYLSLSVAQSCGPAFDLGSLRCWRRT